MATEIFIDPGYVDDGYFGTVDASSNQVHTRFSEYIRGSLPADFTEIYTTPVQGRINAPGSQSRVEGAACDLHHRSALRLQGGVLNTRTGVVWSVVPAHPDQEIYARFRFMTSVANGRSVFILRAGGTLNTENFYSVAFDLGASGTGNLYIKKYVAGTATVLATSSSRTILAGGYYYVRFRAIGNGLAALLWADGSAEPATPDITATDGSITAAGLVGMSCILSSEIIDVSFFSVATRGLRALDESVLPAPLDTWISSESAPIELQVKLQNYNPDTDAVEEFWTSSIGRTTGPLDYPANTVMEPLIIDAGSVTQALSSDAFLAGTGTVSQDPLTLDNRPTRPESPGPLAGWTRRSFAGRPIEYRLGRRYTVLPGRNSDGVLSRCRDFEIVSCGVMPVEPTIATDKVSLQIGSIDNLLSTAIPAYHNIGIPTGVKVLTGSGWVSIPSNGAYDLTSFAIYLRVFVPTSGVAGAGFCTISRRQNGSSAQQWHLELHHASHVTLPNRLQMIVNGSGSSVVVSTSPVTLMNQARFIDVIFGVNSGLSWYMYVDGLKAGSGVPSGVPIVAFGQSVELLTGTSTGCIITDHRVEQYVDENTALSRFAARKDPDTLTVSMHRCDDNTGNTVTDYATLANHGTLQGTDSVDRVWAPTYLGTAALLSTPMPVSGGVVYHVPTQTADPTNSAYRYSDRAKTSGVTIATRSKGVILTPVTNYTEPAGGITDIVGASTEPITVQLNVSAGTEDPHVHVPQLTRDTLFNRTALDYTSCDSESFDALRKLLPFRGGFYFSQPPVIGDFLSTMLTPIGASYLLDRDMRIAAGYMLPPINPGPYGIDTLLEFLGYPGRGVVFGPQSSFDLKQQPTYLIGCIFKTPANLIDLSTSSSFAYFPSGMTLIDRIAGATGYYLGIDGRDGHLIIGAPGVTGAGTGLHYLKLNYDLSPSTWYAVAGGESIGSRGISLCKIDSVGVVANTGESINGAMTASTGAPLKIGYGDRGSFVGSITYVHGSSGGHSASWFAALSFGRPVFGSETGGVFNIADRFWIDLRDGSGDRALDQVTGAYGRIDGCRWAPRVTFDLRKSATPSLPQVRRPLPLWQIQMQFAQNYQTLTGTDVDAAVSAADRAALGMPYTGTTPYNDPGRLSRYRNSLNPPFATPLMTADAAKFVSDANQSRMNIARRYCNVVDWYREALKLSMLDEAIIYSNSFSELASGLPVRIWSLIQHLGAMKVDIDSWG